MPSRIQKVSVIMMSMCLLFLKGKAAAEILPKEIESVKKYILEQEYPELFGDQPYRTRLENALIIDLAGDGQTEVVVQFYPHYRQSPPIVIYRLSKDYKVTRVKEGQDGSILYEDVHSKTKEFDFTPN